MGFEGNSSIPNRTLAASIETAPSSAMRRLTRVVGARRCLAPGALLRDVARLLLFYRRSGYPRVEVDTVVHRAGPGVRVRFTIRENAPLIVDTIDVRGVADRALLSRLRRELTLVSGKPLDLFALDASAAAVLARLRRIGYLTATTRVTDRVDSTALRASVWIDVTTGPQVRLDEIRVDARGLDGGRPRVPASRVRRLTQLQPGRVLGSQELTEARQGLESVGLYDQIRVVVDTVRRTAAGPASADVAVEVIEGAANELHLRAGYGTLDCFRVQLQGARSGVLRRAARLEITTNLSKVAVGSPLDLAPGLCSAAVRDDPYSARLNYYVGATYVVTSPGRRGLTRSGTIYSERRSEYLAYLRTTYLGGSAAATRGLSRYWSTTLAYDLSYGRTEAEPAVLCATFSACLEADREQVTEALRFGLLSASASFNNSNDIADPTRGGTLRAELRIAPSWLGTARRQQVIGGRVNAAAYLRLTRRSVLAARVQGGLVETFANGEFIPQGERLYAGGASTVRGFRQNEIGPRVYVVDSVRTVVQGLDTLFWAVPADSNGWRIVPNGGTRNVIADLELRVRPPVLTSLVQLVFFVDGGAVWIADDPNNGRAKAFVTPGLGARVYTPIGPVRLDIGYNAYAPANGPAYRDVAVGLSTAPLYCVSIGNLLPVTGFGQTDAEGQPIPPVQAEGSCPPTFGPQRPAGFLDRLTVHFSIGQAF